MTFDSSDRVAASMQRQRVIRNLVNTKCRHVADWYFARTRGFEIDIVNANAITHDDACFLHRSDDLCGNRCELGDYCIRVGDQRDQRFRRFALPAAQFDADRSQNIGFDIKRVECVIRDGNYPHCVNPNNRESKFAFVSLRLLRRCMTPNCTELGHRQSSLASIAWEQ